jgi:hypothetical protein
LDRPFLDRLDRSKIEALVKILRDSPPVLQELAKTIANEAEYVERHADQMRYQPSAHKLCSLVPASLRPVVTSSSAHHSNAPACSGPFEALTLSSPCDAVA